MTDEELSKLIGEFLPYPSKDQHYALRSFAKLVASAEREACAKLAVEESAEWHICSQSHDTANMIAAAIRARGQV